MTCLKYKVRTSHSPQTLDKTVYEGHTYKDHQAFLKEFPDTRITEADTVLGCQVSRKVLLTFHFNCCSFMMAYFLFHCFLPDPDRQGRKSQDPDALECGQKNLIHTSIFYCDSMCSWQKPHCEKNHEYIRKICPKGTSFDDYSQKDISLMMSLINSSPRQNLGGLSPMALVNLMLP